MGFHGIPSHLHKPVGDMRPCDGGNPLGLVPGMILGVRREPIETAIGFDVQGHAGQLVF